MTNRNLEQTPSNRWGPDLSGYIELNLQEAFRTLARRKLQIFAVFIILTSIVVFVVSQIAPLYTGTAELVFEAQPAATVDFEAALRGQPHDEASILSQIEVLRSRNLALKVVQDLQLDTEPEFNVSLREQSEISLFIGSLRQYLVQLLIESPPEQTLTEEQIRQRELERVVDVFLEKISVSQQGESRVVTVNFTSEDPELAAAGANAIVDFYLIEQLEGRFDTVRRASSWLADRVLQLRENLETSEESVEQYRQKFGLLRGEQFTLLAEQISDLNAQLTEARVQRTQAETELSQAKRLRVSGGGFASAAQVLESGLIQDLRAQESALERQEAELSQEYGPRHPLMINVRAEQQKLQRRIAGEISKIYASVESRLKVAQARETAIADDLQRLKEQMAQADSSSIGLRMLEREAEANRVMLEKFQTSFMEASAQEHLESLVPIAHTISVAAVPEHHSFPPRTLIVVFGAIGALLTGVVLAFVSEQMDSGFRGPEQIQRVLGFPVLASVPMITGLSAKGDDSRYAIANPSSVFAESIRSIYVRTLLTSSDSQPRTIMLVSSEPEEGKSTIALSLAQLRQKSGQSVIIVDADFRRSVIAKKLGLQQRPGLMDFLSGQIDFEGIVQYDHSSGINLISSGTYLDTGADLLASENMKRLLRHLRENYDLVVLDAAPTLSLSDPQVLSSMVDKTVLVVRWGKTRRHVVSHTVNTLVGAGGQIAGIVLSMVDLKKYAYYGFGDSGHYYGKAKKYYSS